MRNISFVTQYSKKYQGPLVTIVIDDKPILQAIPVAPRELRGDTSSSSKSVHDVFAEEFTKPEYGLYDYEVNAIIEYLTTEDFFKAFYK